MKKYTTYFLLMLFFALHSSIALAYTTSPTSVIDYQLPYPGILPDSPFYTLKIIRDKITGFFISNPLKKAEYSIDISDVRMSAALALSDEKKDPSLIKKTISSSQDYLKEAALNTKMAKDQGINIQDISKKLNQAKHKHQEIIDQIKKQGTDNI
jgi:hypothetical protein